MSCNHNYKNLKVRRGEYRFFKLENPLLDEGEVSHAYKTKDGFYIVKIGDGITRWNDLPCLVFDANLPTTTPGPCYPEQYFKLEDSPYDTSFFAFSTKNRDVEPTSINANIVGGSGYAVNFTGNVSTSPQMSVDYSDRRPRLSYDNYEAVMSVYLGQLDGRQTSVGETIPLFAIGQSNLSAHEVLPSGAISYSILKTSDNNDGSISGTALLYQSDELCESGNRSIRIMPSSWFDTKFERNYYRHKATMSGVVVLDWSYALSGIDIGINATTHSIIAGNALPSGVFSNTEECPEVFAQLNEIFISDSGQYDPSAGKFDVLQGINQQGNSPNDPTVSLVYTEETEVVVKDLNIRSIDSLAVTSGTIMQVYDSNSEKVFEVSGPMVLTGGPPQYGWTDYYPNEFYKNWSGVDPADGVAWNDKLPSGVRHEFYQLNASELEILGLDTIDSNIAPSNMRYLSYRMAGTEDGLNSNYTIKIVKEKIECSDPQVSAGSGLVFDDFIFTRLCPSPTPTTLPPSYYCVIDQTTTPPPPTTTTPAPYNDCGFVSLASLIVGSLATRSNWTNPEINGINAQTPDTCSLLANISCNEPVRECNWRFTSNTSMTFNGDTSSDSGFGNTNVGGDLGSTILNSLDSIFVIEGSSFHIFDHNEVELARFTGPCLIIGEGTKRHYADERILDDSNPSLGGEDIQGNLSTRPASIGGNWGDYITNDRVFFTDDIPNTPEIFYNISTPLNRLHTIASSNEVHRFEIRTSCCTYDENVGPQRFQVFESTATGTPPSGLIFTPDGTKYKYDVVQFLGNNQSVTDPLTASTYTNNTGKFILYDGNQIGTSFSIGDKIKLDPTYWANISTIRPEYTYKITDIMNPGTDLTTLQNDSTFSNSQVLFLECDE